MSRYRFEALTYAGKSEYGIVDSESIRSVRRQLLAKQLVPVTIELDSQFNQARFWQKFFSEEKPLSRNELSMLTKQLALLLRSGVQIDHALTVLSDESSKKHIKNVLQSVVSELRAGLSLSQALAIQESSFDPLYQGIVSAAEQSGRMGQVLTQLSDFLEKKQALKQKALASLIYPAMLTGVSLMVIVFLMTYVIPQIARVFESSKQVLPFTTRFVLGFSHILVDWSWLLIIVIGLSIYFGRKALKRSEIRIRFDRFMLDLPIFGPLILGFETARFAGTMAMLVAANVPILSSLRSAQGTLSNSVLREAIISTEDRLQEGSSLSRALGSQGIFSPILIHLIRSGEASGQLAEMLKYGAENAELEAEQKTKLFTSLLEPALILVMGMLVLGIVMAVMQPILEMNSGIR